MYILTVLYCIAS